MWSAVNQLKEQHIDNISKIIWYISCFLIFIINSKLETIKGGEMFKMGAAIVKLFFEPGNRRTKIILSRKYFTYIARKSGLRRS